MRILLMLCLGMMMSFAAAAQTPPEKEVEQRARDVGRSLRCVVCQNQSIDESDAPLAEDMRKLVRARIRKGDTNEQVIGFMQERYGDYVLLKTAISGQYICAVVCAGRLGFAVFGLVCFARAQENCAA